MGCWRWTSIRESVGRFPRQQRSPKKRADQIKAFGHAPEVGGAGLLLHKADLKTVQGLVPCHLLQPFQKVLLDLRMGSHSVCSDLGFLQSIGSMGLWLLPHPFSPHLLPQSICWSPRDHFVAMYSFLICRFSPFFQRGSEAGVLKGQKVFSSFVLLAPPSFLCRV